MMQENALASGGPSTVASAAAAAAVAAADDVPRVLARNNACHQCRYVHSLIDFQTSRPLIYTAHLAVHCHDEY